MLGTGAERAVQVAVLRDFQHDASDRLAAAHLPAQLSPLASRTADCSRLGFPRGSGAIASPNFTTALLGAECSNNLTMPDRKRNAWIKLDIGRLTVRVGVSGGLPRKRLAAASGIGATRKDRPPCRHPSVGFRILSRVPSIDAAGNSHGAGVLDRPVVPEDNHVHCQRWRYWYS